jgi:hypothetical protein
MPTTEVPSVSTAAPAGTDDDARRVNVIFSKEQFETLQRLADMQKINLSDALRQAINVSELVVKANADPETKILLKKGDSVQELRIVR